jgi:hypothetical protein
MLTCMLVKIVLSKTKKALRLSARGTSALLHPICCEIESVIILVYGPLRCGCTLSTKRKNKSTTIPLPTLAGVKSMVTIAFGDIWFHPAQNRKSLLLQGG